MHKAQLEQCSQRYKQQYSCFRSVMVGILFRHIHTSFITATFT
ncbi:hypothetical protein GPUN_0624 [Glaciecola punicea ACAM 611]|uniref:Uncharacterized protein n=1 Tax=Glaciecola punicea ACAM 611 TaxID=1121923 RepID=H5T8Y7_9ALTE|nr:hypothetical protein GPUN_0624 [Glaciecola punicea ACAM 611]